MTDSNIISQNFEQQVTVNQSTATQVKQVDDQQTVVDNEIHLQVIQTESEQTDVSEDIEIQVKQIEEEQTVLGVGGNQGDKGDKGDRGLKGDPGTGTTAPTVLFGQETPSSIWFITHGLNKYPTVFVKDSAGSTVEGDIEYLNTNQFRITFSGAFSGTAYLN